MKYRKKPVVIEAFQLGFDPLPAWAAEAVNAGIMKEDVITKPHLFEKVAVVIIKTLEGDMFAETGDFIIKGIKGEMYPCKADIFRATYDEVGGMSELAQIMEGFGFGIAIHALKRGHRVARKGWNGKGQFVVYQKGYPEGIPCNKQTAEAWGLSEGDLFRCEPYLQLKMVNGSHSMWVPSINDVLAEDWEILD